MDNRLMLLALLIGLMLLLGCAAQTESQKSGPDTFVPAAGNATGAQMNNTAPAQSDGADAAASTFPSDISEDAGFNGTYGELEAVQ